MTTPINNRTSPKPVPEPPAKLYHGTSAALEPGDVIVPGIEAGTSRGRWVWLEPDPRAAQLWGRLRGGTAVVYQVEPIGDVQTCRSAYRCKSARVVDVVA